MLAATVCKVYTTAFACLSFILTNPSADVQMVNRAHLRMCEYFSTSVFTGAKLYWCQPLLVQTFTGANLHWCQPFSLA